MTIPEEPHHRHPHVNIAGEPMGDASNASASGAAASTTATTTTSAAFAGTKHVRRSSSYQHGDGTPFTLLPVPRHLSMDGMLGKPEPIKYLEAVDHCSALVRRCLLRHSVIAVVSIVVVFVLSFCLPEWQYWHESPHHHRPHPGSRPHIRPIADAVEAYLPLGTTHDGKPIQLWYRTWGNLDDGIPALFVHGGPGNAISDYDDGNTEFFDDRVFYVIEVDQRGTGKSLPSVRDSWKNMQYYLDISIDQMSHDFELLREHLKIDQWLVFGGSWGSTLSLAYGTSYPNRCLGLILRGIYLNSVPEFNAVFSRDSYLTHPKRLKEFDGWFQVAVTEAEQKKLPPLDPNDAERFFRVYEKMIQRGDRNAIWHYHVFENNLMEEVPINILDPNIIDETFYPEAQSIAFFESRLFLHGTFEEPVNMLHRVRRLKQVDYTWICQGTRDEVCPPQYAHQLADALEEHDVSVTARFVNSGHEQTDPVMADCLHNSILEFIARQ